MSQAVVSGIAIGCIYALVAAGFLLVVNATGMLNFAQGAMVTLGAYLGVTGASSLELPLVLTYLFVLCSMALVGWLFRWVAYEPVRDKAMLVKIVATLAVARIVQAGAELVWGVLPRPVPTPVSLQPIRALGVGLYPQHLFVIGVTAVLFAALYVVLNRTFLGAQLRAIAQDTGAASLMGVHTGRMVTITFVLSAVLAGVAGLLLGPISGASSDLGTQPGISAFIAVVIGGFGNIAGAVAGALVLGVLESLAAVYISATYSSAISFAVLIAVLLVRPHGLFGEVVGEKA
jgi:branched-chain amino acid transport system permease protein